MEQKEMIEKVEEWLYELPPNKCLDDAVLREALLSPERIMAIYLVKSGIIKKAQIDVLNKLKDRTRTSYVLDDFILGNVVFSKDIDELIEEIENGKEN